MLFLNHIIPCKTNNFFIPNENKAKEDTLYYTYHGMSIIEKYKGYLIKNLRVSDNETLSQEDFHVSVFLAQKLNLLDANNYSVISDENNKYGFIFLNDDKKESFEKALNEFIKLDDLHDKYLYCHFSVDKETPFMPVNTKDVIWFSESEVSYEESSIFDPKEDESLFKITSDIELTIDPDLLNIDKFIESNTLLLSENDLVILEPLIKYLELDKSENYTPVITNNYYGEELSGFKLNEDKQKVIHDIANKVVLSSDPLEKYRIVEDVIKQNNNNNNKKYRF